jgi:hypothetical protein
MKRIHAATTVLLFLALAALSPAADGPPLDRMLHISLWGESLDETVRAIKEQTGVDVVFYLPDLPAEATREPGVYLVTGQVTLGTVLETLARRFGFRFRMAEGGRVELSRGYDWVGGEQALRFIRTSVLANGEEADEETRAFLQEFIKPIELLGGEYTLRLEPYPVPGDAAHLRGTVVMPAVLADYLERAVACLGGAPGDYPPPPVPNPALYARARDYGADWEGFLARQVSPPRGVDIKSMLSDVADQAGVAIILREPPPASGRGLPEDVEQYTLGRVTEALSAGWNLGKRVFLSCGGVVFERGGGEGFETDARSRELFWNGLAVAGFDAGAAAEKRGAAALTGVLRREVFPGLWRDPVCSLVFSPLSGRLVVVAPLNAVQAVAARLAAF